MSSMAEPPIELMYRRPGASDHENLTEVLDDVIIRLERVEQLLQTLTNKD